ncbi:multidrug resistance-associated protein 4-like [Stegastes partitus]|uniref:Multidrug resistance-associated protein 4-like n=1 Tax=Stegastes partitus TaxID=144197 RepID=A0A9Y4TX15_9TELE|nr:PREDICTED: multidrug resistance-associated protein 4-like [Stegastes partitus]
MEMKKADGRHNPLATAGILSRVFLCWLTPLLHLGPKRRLEESDMFGVLPEDRSETLGKELQRLWDQEVRRATKESEKPKLSRVLIKCYGKSYAVAGLFVFSLVSFGYLKLSLYFVTVIDCIEIIRDMSKTAVLTDSRIRLMNEVVSGIRIIKMYAWEKPFSALLTEVRRTSGPVSGINAFIIQELPTHSGYMRRGWTRRNQRPLPSKRSDSGPEDFIPIPNSSQDMPPETITDPPPNWSPQCSLWHLQTLSCLSHVLCGHIMGQGTYKELQRSGLDVVSLLRTDEEQEQSRSADPEKRSLISQRTSLSHSSHCSNSSLLPPESNGPEQPAVETVGALEEENRAQGNVSCHIYLQYFTASCSLLVLILIVLLSVVAETAYILQDWWLVYWAREEYSNSTATAVHVKNGINVTRSARELNLTFYLGIYSGLTAAAVVFGYIRSLIIFNRLVRSGQTLHNSMFSTVLRTPVHFFDVNPVGRILNRFSKDISQMDSMLPITFVDFYQLILQNAGVVAVAAAVIPLVLIPVVVLLIIFLYLRRFYLSTSRDIKRLESTTRSPVFSHLSSSLQGLWTIRAFRAEERLKKTFDAHQDLHSEAWFLFLMTSRWFALRLDSICSLFITITAFGCILLREGLEAGEVGLVLTYAVTLVGNFQWTVRQSAEVENMMTSVERVVEYTQLQSEAPWETQRRPPPDWPSKGLVTFDQVSFSYSTDGPIILKDISATFHPNEKVGIVGRTGAGKSSLVSALFRLAEPQGKISIDGVQTAETLGGKEIGQILKSSYLRGLNMASFFASSKIIVFVTFTVYVVLGNAITASSVFVTVSLYGTIKLTVTLFFPLAIEKLSETIVSVDRIEDLELLPDGDRTLIGDRGATLSGGQKARINLASLLVLSGHELTTPTPREEPEPAPLDSKLPVPEQFAAASVPVLFPRGTPPLFLIPSWSPPPLFPSR